MAHILAVRPGHVARVEDEVAGAPLTVRAEGLSLDSTRALLTAVGVDAQCSFQLQHTLRNAIYLYTFGERAGTIELSGLLVRDVCGAQPGEHGIERLDRYYRQNGLARRRGPVRLGIGRNSYDGFLVACRTQLDDPVTNMGRFTMRFLSLPGEAARAEGGS